MHLFSKTKCIPLNRNCVAKSDTINDKKKSVFTKGGRVGRRHVSGESLISFNENGMWYSMHGYCKTSYLGVETGLMKTFQFIFMFGLCPNILSLPPSSHYVCLTVSVLQLTDRWLTKGSITESEATS